MKRIRKITDKDIIGTDGMSLAKPRLTARAFLFDENGKVAVMYCKKFSIHCIPGGGIEEGETKIEAVKRELLEETGCECEIKCELGYVYENRGHCDYTTVSYYYAANVTRNHGKTYLTNKEIANGISVEWYNLKDALRIIKGANHRNLQRKFVQRRDLAAFEELFKVISMHSSKITI